MLLLPAAAIMKFPWFIVFYVPDAIQNPYLEHGNEIVTAVDALLFSGVAIVVALTQKPETKRSLRTNYFINLTL